MPIPPTPTATNAAVDQSGHSQQPDVTSLGEGVFLAGRSRAIRAELPPGTNPAAQSATLAAQQGPVEPARLDGGRLSAGEPQPRRGTDGEEMKRPREATPTAGVQAPPEARPRGALLQLDLLTLAKPLASHDVVDKTVRFIPRNAPRPSGEREPGRTSEGGIWSRGSAEKAQVAHFTQILGPHLGQMDNTQLASIQYNLLNTLSSEHRAAPQVQAIHAVIGDLLKARGEGRTLESLLFAPALRAGADPELMSDWVDRRRVDGVLAKQVLKTLPVSQLQQIVSSRAASQRLVGLVLSAIAELMPDVAGHFVDLQSAWHASRQGRAQAPLTPRDISRIGVLVKAHDLYLQCEALSGRPPDAASPVHLARKQVVDALTDALAVERFTVDGLQPKDLKDLAAAAVALGVDRGLVENVRTLHDTVLRQDANEAMSARRLMELAARHDEDGDVIPPPPPLEDESPAEPRDSASGSSHAAPGLLDRVMALVRPAVAEPVAIPASFNELAALPKSHPMRAVFRDYAQAQFVPENFAFYEALEDFEAQLEEPRFEAHRVAAELYGRFIRLGADEQVNISHTAALEIKALLDSGRALTAVDLRAVFAGVRNEVAQLGQTNAFRGGSGSFNEWYQKNRLENP